MFKSVKCFFVVLISSSLFSFSFGDKTKNERLKIGEKAPYPEVHNTKQIANLTNEKGTYTLLSFWASYDAKSRTQNAVLSHVASELPQLKMVSISFDRHPSVYETIIKQDKLDKHLCYREEKGEQSAVYRAYGLEAGFSNYLIDSEGIIIAKNISTKDLTQLVE